MIKFECVKCAQVIEAPDEILGQQVECPSCKAKFWPDKFLPVETPKSLNDLLAQKRGETDWQKIERQAKSFCTFSFLLCGIGVIALLVGIISVGSDKDGGASWLVMGASFSAAVWIYLIAQIIHIRALLAKK